MMSEKDTLMLPFFSVYEKYMIVSRIHSCLLSRFFLMFEKKLLFEMLRELKDWLPHL